MKAKFPADIFLLPFPGDCAVESTLSRSKAQSKAIRQRRITSRFDRLQLMWRGFLAVAIVAAGVQSSRAVTTSTWVAPVSGSWHQGSHWSDGVAPQNGVPLVTDSYDIVIAAMDSANYLVDTTAAVTVNSVLVNSAQATLAIRDKEFTAVNGIRVEAGALQLGHIDGGDPVISNTHITVSPSARFSGTGTLTASTLTGAWSLASDETGAISGGLNLDDGRIELTGTLQFLGDQVLDGAGEIIFGSGEDAQLLPGPSSLLIIGPNITVRTGGGRGVIGVAPTARGIVLEGTLSARNNAQSINVFDDNFLNNGTVEALDGASIRFADGSLGVGATGGTWRASGRSRIIMEGSFTARHNDRFHLILSETNGFSLFEVLGSATWNGILDVELESGYIPVPGSRFRLISSREGRSGAFSEINLPPLPESFSWNMSEFTSTGRVTVEGPPATLVAHSNFTEPPLGARHYNPGPSGQELGFQTTVKSSSDASVAGTAVASWFGAADPVFVHDSISATTTFETVDLDHWFARRFSVAIRVGVGTYEEGDFLHIYLTNGTEQLDMFRGEGTAASNDPLDNRASLGLATFSIDIPPSWTSAQLVMSSSSNANGAEKYAIGQLRFTGYFAVPEPSGLATLASFFPLVLTFTRRLMTRRAATNLTRNEHLRLAFINRDQ